MLKIPAWLCAGLLVSAVAAAQQPESKSSAPKSIGERIAGLQKIEGFVPLYWDANGGRMLMEIPRFDTELLYQLSLPAGIGSNPIGLDRGQLGGSHVVVFQRIGPKVLMAQPNYRYRAITDNAAERRAVEDSFAKSVLWGFKVEAAEGNRVLVDATQFFRARGHRSSAPDSAGAVPHGRQPERLSSAPHEGFPAEHGSGDDHHVYHRRRSGASPLPGRPHRPVPHCAGASLVRRVAG
jgi:hypothetical protein